MPQNQQFGILGGHHPLVGELTLGYEAFTPIGDPDQTLGIYTVKPGSPSEDALRMLASWNIDTASITPRHPPRANPARLR
ncbi:MmyB family transcriptional regulator [Streptomyces sp. NPDC002206]